MWPCSLWFAVVLLVGAIIVCMTEIISAHAYHVTNRWVWVGVGFLIGAIIVFHIIIIAAVKLLGPLGKNAAVLSEEALRARDISLFGQSGKGDVDDTALDVNEVCINLCFQARKSDESQLAPYPRL